MPACFLWHSWKQSDFGTALSGKFELMEEQQKASGTINMKHVRQLLGKVEYFFFFNSLWDQMNLISFYTYFVPWAFSGGSSPFLPWWTVGIFFLLCSFFSLHLFSWPFEFSTCQVLKVPFFVEFKEWFLYGYCLWGTLKYSFCLFLHQVTFVFSSFGSLLLQNT